MDGLLHVFSMCVLVSVVTFLYLVYVIGPGQSIACFFGSRTVKALSHRLPRDSSLLVCSRLPLVITFPPTPAFPPEQGDLRLLDLPLSSRCAKGRGATSACVRTSGFLALSSQHGAWSSLIPPREVVAVASGLVALRGVVSVPWSHIWAEREAEASCAVADLEQAVRAQEGFSLTPCLVVDCLQVIVDGDVSQLFPALLRPPPSHEGDARHQNQQKDSQYAGDGDGGGGMVGSLARSRLEAAPQRELTAGSHEALRALAHRPREVGEASAAVLARAFSAGVGPHAAVLASVAQRAGTSVVVHAILTGSCVLAGARGAIVNVHLAVGAGKAGLTATQHALTEVQTLATCRARIFWSASTTSVGVFFFVFFFPQKKFPQSETARASSSHGVATRWRN